MPTTTSSPSSDGSDPFVGRHEILATAAATFAETNLLLIGPSGIGKTRLAHELLRAVDGPVEHLFASPVTREHRLGSLSVLGNQGDDNMFGDDGDDFVVGGFGDDTVRGENGDDTVLGGSGADFVNGDAPATRARRRSPLRPLLRRTQAGRDRELRTSVAGRS